MNMLRARNMRFATDTASRTSVASRKPKIRPDATTIPPGAETHQLIQACKAGDLVAWNALARRCQPIIFRYVYSLCRNRDETEDIASEPLVRLYQERDSFREEGNFTTWLLCIARHIYVDPECVKGARGISRAVSQVRG